MIFYEKIKFDKAAIISICTSIGFLGIVIANSYYKGDGYFYNEKAEVSSKNTNKNNIYTNENGELCCLFDVGEHRISISRRDFFCHNIEAVEGYEIENVEVIGWDDISKVVYVNKEPVVVKASGVKEDGKIEFANFGEVVKEKARIIK